MSDHHWAQAIGCPANYEGAPPLEERIARRRARELAEWEASRQPCDLDARRSTLISVRIVAQHMEALDKLQCDLQMSRSQVLRGVISAGLWAMLPDVPAPEGLPCELRAGPPGA